MNHLANARHFASMLAWALDRCDDGPLAGATGKLAQDARRIQQGIDRISPVAVQAPEDPARWLPVSERWIYEYLMDAGRLVSVGEGTRAAAAAGRNPGKNWFRRNAQRLVARGMAVNPQHGLYGGVKP